MIGLIAGKLGICGIGVASEEGEIVISHCKNPELAGELEGRIKEIWNSADIQIIVAGGLCSFYAERKGLIVAY